MPNLVISRSSLTKKRERKRKRENENRVPNDERKNFRQSSAPFSHEEESYRLLAPSLLDADTFGRQSYPAG